MNTEHFLSQEERNLYNPAYIGAMVIPPKLTAMKSRKINSPAATVEWA
jgi:hypothetical protein